MKGQESNRGKAKHSTGETWRAGLPQCCLWPRVRQLAFHNPTLLSRSLKPTPEGCKALQVLPAAESHEIKKKKNEPKTLTDPSPKKMYKWQMSKWKNVPPDVSSGKCKLNWDTTIYPLELPKYRTLTIPSAGESVGQQEFSFINCWWKSKMVQPLWEIG